MNRFQWHIALWLGAFVTVAPNAMAQRAQFGPQVPQIGYVYPAGGRQGDIVNIALGGQYLDDVAQVIVSGGGVQAAVVEHTKPLTQRQINQLQQKLQEARKRLQTTQRKKGAGGERGTYKAFIEVAKEAGVDPEELKTLNELRKQRSDPKYQPNPQIAETVTLKVTLAADAEPGEREVRVRTPNGLSNPLFFHVGQFPEYNETEPNDKALNTEIEAPLPFVLNGQILPGDVDRFRFKARQGERLVVVASARELKPYLADAVPGWFQATLVLYDTDGKEVAYADDYRFDPDPVFYYEIPKDGQYVLEIKDAIYRGREDFVYRITLGEVPFVTSIFPLGGRDDDQPTVAMTGWNLPVHKLTLDAKDTEPGIHPISVSKQGRVSNHVPFAVDTLPERLEEEPNDEPSNAQRVETPVIVNGRIDRSGDKDVFRFDGRAGDQIVAEVQARRLNSPLDSVLELTDAKGRQLMINDDFEDKGAGLTTHQADSRLSITLPEDGTYYLTLGDTQGQGGAAVNYRLRVSPKRPDFELRVVPSSINARAGASVPITVYALRRDGFSGDITLELKDAPQGFRLSGAWVPADQDKVRLTLTVPAMPREKPFTLHLEGHATIQGREVRRAAIPAEDMMQAFIYRHLVPAEDLMVAVTGRAGSKGATQFRGQGRGRNLANFRGDGRYGAPLRSFASKPVKLPAGGTVRVPMPLPGGAFLDQIQLALSEPPEGITIEKVSSGGRDAAILLRADADKAKIGLKGNLIVAAFVERAVRTPAGTKGGNKRRFQVGTLPAIPFEIVEP